MDTKIIWVYAVIDPREPSADGFPKLPLEHPADKPIGTLYDPRPPGPRKGSIQEAVAAAAELRHPKQPPKRAVDPERMAKVMAKPTYQPADYQEFSLGFQTAYSTSDSRPAICIRCRVDAKHLPPTFNTDLIRDEEVFLKLRLPGDALKNFSPASLVKFWDDENDKENFRQKSLPLSILTEKRFEEDKSKIYRLAVSLDVSGFAQDYLYSPQTFTHSGVHRSIQVMRAIGSAGLSSFYIYMLSGKSCDPEALVRSLSVAINSEREHGNVYRHFYTQNLQTGSGMHDLDSESALRPPEDRPTITTYPQTSYNDLFEFTTRMGVAVMQCLEDASAKVLELNTHPVAIRVLKMPRGGDTRYVAFFDKFGINLRLNPGDKLRINFRLVNRRKEEEWSMVIMGPPMFALPGEVFGILHRPRVPKSTVLNIIDGSGPDHDVDVPDYDENHSTQPFQTTDIPTGSFGDVHNSQDPRAALFAIPATWCYVTFNASDRPEARTIKALANLARGTREQISKGRSIKLDAPSVQAFADILLMHSAIPDSYRSCLNPEGVTYLKEKLVDEDHVQLIEYLQNLPVKNDKGVGMIVGYAGTGKTFATAQIIVAILKSDPNAVIAITGPSDSVIDVSMAKTKEAINNSGITDVQVVRSCTNATELAYMISRSYEDPPAIDYLFVAQAGKVNLADLSVPLANLEIENLILVGDDKQLSPVVPYLEVPGCTKELGQSAIAYFRANMWPHSVLNLQRRGPPGIASIYGHIFYQGKIKDSPCASLPDAHPATSKILDFYKKEFPEISSDLPLRFFEIKCNEVKDANTGSYYNLGSAAFIMNLIEAMAKSGLDITDTPIITNYAAQQKVYRHALTALHRENPTLGYDKVICYTTDSIQGRQASHPLVDPVRTRKMGFTGDKGRSAVILSRGADFCTVVGRTYELQGKGIPLTRYVFDLARKMGISTDVAGQP